MLVKFAAREIGAKWTDTPNAVNVLKCFNRRKSSSHQWLQRQQKDVYVKKARTEQWRCRSAYKLIQIDDRYRIFRPGDVVIDCGAAPGSWTQVAVRRTTSSVCRGHVIGIDLLPIRPIAGAILLDHTDFATPETQKRLLQILDGRQADSVLSDMAPNASGNEEMDHDRIVELCLSVLRFASAVLKPTTGKLLCKLWDGASREQLEESVEERFAEARLVKPDASRSESAEIYVLATGFREKT